MITIRYKETGTGKFSVYLDIYQKDEKGKVARKYEFLRIYVTRDYSKTKRVAAIDNEKMELAKSIRSKRELELYGTVSGLNGQPKRVNLSILDYIWRDYQKTHRKNYYQLLKHLEQYSGGKDILFSDVNLPFIENFQKRLLERDSRNTTLHYLSLLKKFISKAFKEEIIAFNPFEKHKMLSKQESDRTFLELHEIKALSDTIVPCEPHICDAFLFSCFTGLRFSDVKTLSRSHISKDKDKDENEYPVIRLRPIKTTRTTGKYLKVPLSEQAIKILKAQKKKRDSDLVFFNLPDKNTTNYWLRKWAKAAGIGKHLHYHVSRHTFATLGLTSGIDIYTVSKLMGHTRLDATQVYAKVIEEKKLKEVQKFPGFSLKSNKKGNEKKREKERDKQRK
ncbi:MAG TPA: site-specific integrase [Bacteroidales bacterium]